MNELTEKPMAIKTAKRESRKRERELTDIRSVLLTPQGRRFYWRVMESGAIFQDPFCGVDTNATNYRLGRQSISRDFLNDLMEASPDALAQMQREQASLDASDLRQEQEDLKNSGGLI